MKNKLFLTAIILFSTLTSCSAEVTFDDLINYKKPAYRVGTTNDIESEFKVKETIQYEELIAKTKRAQVKDKTYADTTLRELSKELGKEIASEKQDLIGDIRILWAGAAAKSETVKFTIYKLSNPDADKPDENIIKKVISPIASFSAMAGAGFLNPVAATSAIMGSSLLGSLTTNDKDLNYKYKKVTDADMIVLLKRIDELQQELIKAYVDYMTGLEKLDRIEKIVEKRGQILTNVQNLSHEINLVADSNYRNALNLKRSIEMDFLAKRARLEQIAGVDAMAEFEETLKLRKAIN